MLHLVSDENFNADIVRGLLLREPQLDLVSLQAVGLQGAGDPEILAWAAENDRIVLTHDRATMPDFVARGRRQRTNGVDGLDRVSPSVAFSQPERFRTRRDHATPD